MNGIFFIIGLFVFFYVVGKVSDFFEEKSAAKKIPLVEDEIKNLSQKVEKYLNYELLIDDSVKEFRRDDERKKAQRTYFAEKRNGSYYKRKTKRFY